MQWATPKKNFPIMCYKSFRVWTRSCKGPHGEQTGRKRCKENSKIWKSKQTVVPCGVCVPIAISPLLCLFHSENFLMLQDNRSTMKMAVDGYSGRIELIGDWRASLRFSCVGDKNCCHLAWLHALCEYVAAAAAAELWNMVS